MFGICRATGLCAAVVAGLALAGCTSPTMIFDAATTVAEDRTMSQVASDAGLKIDINAKLLSNPYATLCSPGRTSDCERSVTSAPTLLRRRMSLRSLSTEKLVLGTADTSS